VKRTRVEIGLAFLLFAAPVEPAPLQRAGGPQLEVTVLAANSPPAGASVRAAKLLGDPSTRDLLQNGFPAELRFRLELWRVGGLFDDLEQVANWVVRVRYEPYRQQYLVVRLQGPNVQDFGGFPTLEQAEGVIDRP